MTAGTVAELCCGPGGQALGFSQYFEIVHACDIKEEVVRTYGANHPETQVRRQDIRLLTGCRGDFDGITGVIHDRIKALLIEVELNVLDFSQGMMAFLAIPDKTGRPQALQDYILDNKGQLSAGTFDITYQLPEGKHP